MQIRLDSTEYAQFYHSPTKVDSAYTGYLRQTKEGVQLRFDANATLPDPPRQDGQFAATNFCCTVARTHAMRAPSFEAKWSE